MNRLERFYKIDQILQDRKVVSRDVFLSILEISPATFKRDLEYMRDRFNAPVIYDSDLRGYRYENTASTKNKLSLPGLWFTEQEIFALITMQQLLENLDQGSIIGPHIRPFLSRLDAVIGEGESSSKEIRKRIKLVEMGRRVQGSHFFSEVGVALLKRQRIEIQYYGRGKNEIILREISPQRLIHYRDKWYLDAWCSTILVLQLLDAGLRCSINKSGGTAEVDGGVSEGYGGVSCRSRQPKEGQGFANRVAAGVKFA